MKTQETQQYEHALSRIEELLPLVNEDTSTEDKNAKELAAMSDIVVAYEKKHYPMERSY